MKSLPKPSKGGDVLVQSFLIARASASVDFHVPQGTLCAFGFCAIRAFRIKNDFSNLV